MALTDAAEYLNLTTQSQIRRLHETQQKTRVMNESKEVLNLSNLKKKYTALFLRTIQMYRQHKKKCSPQRLKNTRENF